MSFDSPFFDPPQEDVILVMGMTGSGKSTFVDLFCAADNFTLGHDYHSDSSEIHKLWGFYKDEDGHERVLWLLDTPGFGDINGLDSETLELIRVGLMDHPEITGIIYFHDINDIQVTHLAYEAKEIFYELCGREAMGNVVLCTSKWDKLVDKTEGERRVTQLRGNYWKKMVDDGAQMARHDNSQSSAAEILKLLHGRRPITPKLVTELRQSPNASIGDTSAGRVANRFHDEKEKEIERYILRKSQKEAEGRVNEPEAYRPEPEVQPAWREAVPDAGCQTTDLPPEDVIMIMGMNESAKSTFVNLICGTNNFRVGHDFESGTGVIHKVWGFYQDAESRERVLWLLDIPGLDNLDSETLEYIHAELLQCPEITGIIYFHDINENRLTHFAHQAQELFYAVCRGDAMQNFVLCTSRWDELRDRKEGERRASQLRIYHWKQIVNAGARMAEHDGSQSSARAALQLVLGRDSVMPGSARTELRSVEELRQSVRDAELRAQQLESQRAEDERIRQKREAEIQEQVLKAATEAQETERLRAERVRQATEERLEKLKRDKEAAEKRREAETARQNARALRAEDENRRLQAELERMKRESVNFAKPFDVLEPIEQIGMPRGKKIGRITGRVVGFFDT